MSMTYPQAREAIFAYIRKEDPQTYGQRWTVKANLKVPQLITPSGHVVRFQAQAVYLDAHSLFIDIRKITPEQFLEAVMAREGRDPSGRSVKSSAHGQKASEYVSRGRAAEDAGMFSSAAVWYGKAAAHYAKAYGPHHLRARLWAKRAKDVKKPAGKRQMGTTYRGERKAWHRDPSKRRRSRDFGDESGHTRESYETLRRQARQAEKAKDYLKASRLYERLADIFPDDHPRGVMFRRRATLMASGTARIRPYFKEAREKYEQRKKRSAAYYAKKSKKSRDPSKRRIVHGKAGGHKLPSWPRTEAPNPHGPSDRAEYVLHWYSPEDRREHATHWVGPADYRQARKEAEAYCDRSESKRYSWLEGTGKKARDPAMHKRSHHRAKKARALRVTDDLKFYDRGARRRPKIVKRHRLRGDLYAVVGRGGRVLGHVKGTWLGEAERRAKLKFGPLAHVWATRSRRVVGSIFTLEGGF